MVSFNKEVCRNAANHAAQSISNGAEYAVQFGKSVVQEIKPILPTALARAPISGAALCAVFFGVFGPPVGGLKAIAAALGITTGFSFLSAVMTPLMMNQATKTASLVTEFVSRVPENKYTAQLGNSLVMRETKALLPTAIATAAAALVSGAATGAAMSVIYPPVNREQLTEIFQFTMVFSLITGVSMSLVSSCCTRIKANTAQKTAQAAAEQFENVKPSIPEDAQKV